MPKKSAPGRAAAPDWYRVKALANAEAEISIFGDIGESWWADESITAKSLTSELQALGNVEYLSVRINSYGGSVSDGLAIYNALKRHPAAVTVHIEGVAVSIASLIAMAGDTIIMPSNALMMIHAPWSYTEGNAKEMREKADVLDKYAAAMAASYAEKTGIPHAEILSMLSDGEDHWMTAAEAVERGFADAMTEPLAIAASLNMIRFNPAAAAAITQEEKPMADSKAKAPEAVTTDPQGVNVTEIEKAAAAKAADAIKARNESIRAQFKPFLARAGVRDLHDEILSDPAVTAEAAGQKLLAKLAEGVEPLTPKAHAPRVDAGADEADKRRAAVADALQARAGVAAQDVRARVDGSNPYRGMTLLELARDRAEAAGVSTRGMDKLQVVAAAFTQSTSDFPVLLEDAMHKTLQSAYRLAPDTWTRFCATGSVSDFRDHHRYRLGSLGNLDAVNELGEFTNKAIPDGERASVNVRTKGNIINLSRQTIINDDLGAFIGAAAMLGRAARRSIEADVYALLAENAGLGPTQADGQPLLHANRANVDTTAGANSVARWDAMRILMARQMDVSGNDYLDIRPAIWLGPIGLGGAARGVNEAEYDDEATRNQRKPNISRGLVRDIVDTPRLAGNRYYLLADPSEAPVFEVVFLDGQQEPFLDRQDGFDVDGTRWKVRLDYGVHAVDYRGIVTNAGQ